MDDSNRIRVLLVGDSPHLFLFCQKQLEKNGCEYEFVDCEHAVLKALVQRPFDLVLSLHTHRANRRPNLTVMLRGSPTTLFYALRVEVGYWWVPILRSGEECFGAPALRPSEFADALDDVLKKIRVEAAWCGNRMRAT